MSKYCKTRSLGHIRRRRRFEMRIRKPLFTRSVV